MKMMRDFHVWLDKAKGAGWVNKFTIAACVFLVWMMFFDKHNMMVQFELRKRASVLKEQIATDKVNLQAARDELKIIKEEQELYARKKYKMHKPDEEVFVVTHK